MTAPTPTTASLPRLRLTDYEPRLDTLREEVLAGLSSMPRTLPCKFFYDRRGSALFDRICELPEYYPTRTELGIMRRHARAIADAIGPAALVAELGSGSSVKTRILLEHLHRPVAYVPIDISRAHLLATSRALAASYPRIEVLPVCADYGRDFAIPTPSRPARQTAFYFPGSTIGNLHPVEAAAFLTRLRSLAVSGARPGGTDRGGLLIGVDLVKPRSILLPAYDDAEGVTAAFNANLLVRINRELGADFRLSRFVHRAAWNEAASRVEMHLEALEAHAVHLGGRRFAFESGEIIHTENSYKWTVDGFTDLAAAAGWTHRRTWTDDRKWFAVLWFEG